MTEQNSTNDDDFDFGELGREWWLQAGEQCKATRQQIKFACARHRGASATAAARLSGYAESETDPSQIRQGGYRAARTTAVLSMLALASAETDGPPQSKILSREERAQRLSELARSPDPNLAVRAIEALDRADQRAIETGSSRDSDGFSNWRVCRDMLTLPGGTLAWLSLWCSQGSALSGTPLLHDIYERVLREGLQAEWDKFVKRNSSVMQQDLRHCLANPNWQYEARVKLWREIGVELDPQLSNAAIEEKVNQGPPTTAPNAKLNGTANQGAN